MSHDHGAGQATWRTSKSSSRPATGVGEEFQAIGDLRPGSLQENFTRCGKPNCHRAEDGAALDPVVESLERVRTFLQLRLQVIEPVD